MILLEMKGFLELVFVRIRVKIWMVVVNSDVYVLIVLCFGVVKFRR